MDGLGFIALYNNLEPYGNHIVDLGSLYRAYRALYVRDVQAGYVTAQAVFTDSIGSASNTNFYITPWPGRSINLVANTTVDGDLTVNGRITGSGANPFNQDLNTYNAVRFNDITNTGSLTVSGNITCHGALDVTHLRADGPYSIVLYSDMLPYGTRNLGSENNYFTSMWVAMACYKGSYQFNCERSTSGQEVVRQIQNQQDALKVLTHEVTKTVYHTTYNFEKGHEDEIICVCGKSVKQPCPEHQKEWLDKYATNTGKTQEATAFLTLEHHAVLTRQQVVIETLQEKIAMLEEKLAKQTEVIRND